MTPTLSLAIEDFVPVLLTLLALILLSRMIFDMDRLSGYLAILGLILVVLGGQLKATSKLIWVIFGSQVPWMENSLFLLMAPGFAILAWALWSGQRRLFQDIQTKYVLHVPIFILLLIGVGTIFFNNNNNQGRIWFFVLLSLVVVMSSFLLILLSRHAWHYRLKGIALLFLLYLVITLLLNGMARTPSTSVNMEWIKQLVNTAAAGILAFASWRLWLTTR